MNLKEWAARNGVGYATARRWFAEGALPVPARRVGGLILVMDESEPAPAGTTVVYARVSSAGQEAGLDRQVARVTGWATSQGLTVGRVVTEVGPALNGHRRKFLALLRDSQLTTIVVEHRDRVARFGAEYAGAALAASGRRLLAVDPAARAAVPCRGCAGGVQLGAGPGEKDTAAPWWRECSKEAFTTGLDQLARALKNWAGCWPGVPRTATDVEPAVRRDSSRRWL